MSLRDYQSNAVDAVLNFFKYRAPLHGYVVAPGGSGKSHMIAAVAERLFDLGHHVVILARSEKLLTQNKSKFVQKYHEHIGVYCAGLKSWVVDKPITIASAQSIANITLPIKPVAILVDECDEISDDEDSQYQTFFRLNGNPLIYGFTATAFRTGTGNLSWGEEIINIPIKAIMDAGHLTPPTNKVGTILDLSGIEVRLGDYVSKQIEAVYDDPELLRLSISKIKQYSADRSGVLIFCQSLRHADMVAFAMEENGMPCTLVSGDTDKDDLTAILHDFEQGSIKYIINVALLIRGYDMPCVDMIALLLATKSKRKFEQILYRGTRLKAGKKDFLVLDMGNNFAEHGPLGSPYLGKGGKRDAKYMGRVCPNCEDYVTPLNAKECTTCAYEFPAPEASQVRHAYDADSTSSTVYDGPTNIYEVTGVTYNRHPGKNGKPDTLKITYYCGFGKYGNVSEWLSVHANSNEWARKKAEKLFKDRGNELGSPIETYSFDDLLWHAEQLQTPERIEVDHSSEFPRITYYWWPKPSTPEVNLDELLGDSIVY